MENEKKIAAGKLYEKLEIIRNNTDKLAVASCMNKATGTKELIVIYKDGETFVPLAKLLTEKDLSLLEPQFIESEIIEAVFAEYRSTDTRKTLQEFNGYHPTDKKYAKMSELLKAGKLHSLVKEFNETPNR